MVLLLVVLALTWFFFLSFLPLSQCAVALRACHDDQISGQSQSAQQTWTVLEPHGPDHLGLLGCFGSAGQLHLAATQEAWKDKWLLALLVVEW